MKTRLLVLLFAFCCLSLYSQQIQTYSVPKSETQPPITLSKNSVGIDISSLYLIYASSVNYERLLSRNEACSQSFYVRVGVGYFIMGEVGGSSSDGIQIPTSIVYLGGKKSSHFEVDFGFRTIFDWNEATHETGYLIINVGYRYQRPGKGLFFKALAGTDGLTLGAGFAF